MITMIYYSNLVSSSLIYCFYPNLLVSDIYLYLIYFFNEFFFRLLWRDLCLFHFDNSQLMAVNKNNKDLSQFTTEDWKFLYNRLLK